MADDKAPTEKQPTIWDNLRRAIDDLEVTANQAGTEVKERWTALKPRLAKLKEKMEVKSAEASAWVAEEVDLIGAEVNRLKDDVASRLKKK
jgi:hypothetical protein